MLHTSFGDAVEQAIPALAAQGFEALTTIDVRPTLNQTPGQEIEGYLILGACNPELAHRAWDVDRQIGQLMPCNLVVRTDPADTQGDPVTVEAMDPQLMVQATSQPNLHDMADQATAKLRAAISAISADEMQTSR